jgi:hypothetical protein
MSILGNILTKLGLKKPEEPKAAAKPVVTKVPYKYAQRGIAQSKNVPGTMGKVTSTVHAAVPVVDVMAKMEELAKKSTIPDLNWKQSINDLMALLGLDHKAEDIKALAVELGCPESEMSDSYKRNVWTHKALLKKIAENGGNIPASLLD